MYLLASSIKKNKNKKRNNVPVTAKTITIQAPKINKATTTTIPLTKKLKTSKLSKSKARPNTSARPKVAAKKATVRAPVTTRTAIRTTTRTTRNSSIKQKLSGKNEEFDVISLGSLNSASSNENSKDSNKNEKNNNETENIEVIRSKTYEVVRSKKISKPDTKIRIIQEGPISNGRVKKAKKEQEINGPESSVKIGRRHSRPREFLGGIRLATIASNMFNLDNSGGPKSIVLEKSTFDVTKERRKRVSWSEEEVENLKAGVKRHGEGSWSSILHDTN